MPVRIAAVGTASTGKSALLNALFGTEFAVDARAGSTSRLTRALATFESTDVEVIDTPPIETLSGPVSADVFLLVCDKDLTKAEYHEAYRIARTGRPLLVVLNKLDTYSPDQVVNLMAHIRARLHGVISSTHVVGAAADPVRVICRIQADGSTVESTVPSSKRVDQVTAVLPEALGEANASVRVQAREYARVAATRVRSAATAGWKKLTDATRESRS